MIFTVQTGNFAGTHPRPSPTPTKKGGGEGNQKSILLVMSTLNMSNFIDENKKCPRQTLSLAEKTSRPYRTRATKPLLYILAKRFSIHISRRASFSFLLLLNYVHALDIEIQEGLIKP